MTYKDIERSIKLLNELNQKHWTEVGFYGLSPVFNFEKTDAGGWPTKHKGKCEVSVRVVEHGDPNMYSKPAFDTVIIGTYKEVTQWVALQQLVGIALIRYGDPFATA